MTISLVIPAYNEAAYIGPCLDSAIAHTYGKLHQIIVVDNASTDKTGEIARQRPGAKTAKARGTPGKPALSMRPEISSCT